MQSMNDLLDRSRLERRPPGNEMIQNRTNAIYVAGWDQRRAPARRLLRWHVVR